MVKEVYLNAKMRDQGWGNPTWGCWIKGYKDGVEKWAYKVKAPRSVKSIFKRVCWGWWVWSSCVNVKKRVQGPPISNIYSNNNVQNKSPVDSIRIILQTEGQGHSIDLDSVEWRITGYPE